MKLPVNEGPVDRSLRIGGGIVLIALASLTLSGLLQILVLVLAIALIVTGIIGFCGVYTLLGINTCPTDLSSKKSKTKRN